MRADVCDPKDNAALLRFFAALRKLGASPPEKAWGPGVHVYHVKIGGEPLTLISNNWSVDIDGPNTVVERVLLEFENTSSASLAARRHDADCGPHSLPAAAFP